MQELINALDAIGIKAHIVDSGAVQWKTFEDNSPLHKRVALVLADAAEAEEKADARRAIKTVHKILEKEKTNELTWEEARAHMWKYTHGETLYLLSPPDKYCVAFQGYGTHPDFQ